MPCWALLKRAVPDFGVPCCAPLLFAEATPCHFVPKHSCCQPARCPIPPSSLVGATLTVKTPRQGCRQLRSMSWLSCRHCLGFSSHELRLGIFWTLGQKFARILMASLRSFCNFMWILWAAQSFSAVSRIDGIAFCQDRFHRSWMGSVGGIQTQSVEHTGT